MTADGEDGTAVAVTGAAGFIGSRVLHELRVAHPEWTLVGIDNQFLGQVSSVANIDIDHVDIRDRPTLEDHLKGVDAVLHFAAVSGVADCDRNPDLAYQVNVTGTNNIAWFCRRNRIPLAFPYSMAVVGDPESFPVTADAPRDPLNWYGRTKLLSEQCIEAFADGAFPAHLFLKSNLYGEHRIDGTTVSKDTVINFFVDRAIAGEPLPVYEPGTQSRNFVHVKDVARAYVDSTERLLRQSRADETGAETYELGSDEDPSVISVARTVQRLAAEELGVDIDIELVENPRSDETTVESFTVDTSRARDVLGWEINHTVESSIRDLLRADD